MSTDAGGAWEPGTLPEGVREATGRRLSRLSDAANDALAVAAVVGTTFDLALVEQVRGADLIDPIAEACRAGLVVEEPGALARFRFAHALVRQVLLAELVTLKRVRLHRTIAELLEAAPTAADPDARLGRSRVPLVRVRVDRERRQGRRRVPAGRPIGRWNASRTRRRATSTRWRCRPSTRSTTSIPRSRPRCTSRGATRC